jgi:hypothetical protein
LPNKKKFKPEVFFFKSAAACPGTFYIEIRRQIAGTIKQSTTKGKQADYFYFIFIADFSHAKEYINPFTISFY